MAEICPPIMTNEQLNQILDEAWPLSKLCPYRIIDGKTTLCHDGFPSTVENKNGKNACAAWGRINCIGDKGCRLIERPL